MLNKTDIDVWTDNIHTYYTYDPSNVETEFKPVIGKVHRYNLHSDNASSEEQHSVASIKEENIQSEPNHKKTRDSRPP